MNDFISKDDGKLSTKDRISMVCFKLLRENSNMNITISQVCKAAGITKSTFYYYYHSIDEVIESFSDIISIELSKAMPEIFAQKTCVEQALLAIKVVDTAVEQLGPSVASSRYSMHLKKGDYPGFHAEAGWQLVVAISGLGAAAANDLMSCREGGRRFISVEELSLACPKVSQAHIEQLRATGALGDMPEESQMTLF